MEIHVFYHDQCFDGAASAALLSRFLQDSYYPDGHYRFLGLLHTPRFHWNDVSFDGDEIVIVDFRYCTDRRVTWWFDHHQSAFLNEKDRAHFQADRTGQKIFDCAYSSCTALIADHLRRSFGYVAEGLSELIYWADVIDGAKYPTPQASIDLLAPAARLRLIIENAENPGIREQVVRRMRFQKMEEILADPEINVLETRLVREQVKLGDLLLKAVELHGRVALFDLTDKVLNSFNKFLPYCMFQDVDYVVAVLRIGDWLKVSLGTNPWRTSQRPANLARIAQRFGGGGHAAVAGITLGLDEGLRARAIVDAITAELSATD